MRLLAGALVAMGGVYLVVLAVQAARRLDLWQERSAVGERMSQRWIEAHQESGGL